MSTPAQIAANQANAKLSTGPTSDTGKQIASQNSTKHQLTGKGNPALPGEEDAVEEHVQGYFQTYAPVGLPEQDLVRNLAENNWRLQRAHSLERNLHCRLGALEGDSFDETAPRTAPHFPVRPPHPARYRKEPRRTEIAAVRAQSGLRSSAGRSHPAHPTGIRQRPNGGRHERFPVPRTLRWLRLFHARNPAHPRPRSPPG